MAHETAHIAGHDPLNHLARNLGSNAIARIFGIGLGLSNVSSLEGQLVSLSYSRDMERVVDLRGVTYLEASDLSSDGLAAFFAAVPEREADNGLPDFLSDHPLTSERKKMNSGSPSVEDAMTDGNWQAITAMCVQPV